MLAYFVFSWGREMFPSQWVQRFIGFVSYGLFISWLSCISWSCIFSWPINIEYFGYFSAPHVLDTKLWTYELTRRMFQAPCRVKPDCPGCSSVPGSST